MQCYIDQKDVPVTIITSRNNIKQNRKDMETAAKDYCSAIINLPERGVQDIIIVCARMFRVVEVNEERSWVRKWHGDWITCYVSKDTYRFSSMGSVAMPVHTGFGGIAF